MTANYIVQRLIEDAGFETRPCNIGGGHAPCLAVRTPYGFQLVAAVLREVARQRLQESQRSAALEALAHAFQRADDYGDGHWVYFRQTPYLDQYPTDEEFAELLANC